MSKIMDIFTRKAKIENKLKNCIVLDPGKPSWFKVESNRKFPEFRVAGKER